MFVRYRLELSAIYTHVYVYIYLYLLLHIFLPMWMEEAKDILLLSACMYVYAKNVYVRMFRPMSCTYSSRLHGVVGQQIIFLKKYIKGGFWFLHWFYIFNCFGYFWTILIVHIFKELFKIGWLFVKIYIFISPIKDIKKYNKSIPARLKPGLRERGRRQVTVFCSCEGGEGNVCLTYRPLGRCWPKDLYKSPPPKKNFKTRQNYPPPPPLPSPLSSIKVIFLTCLSQLIADLGNGRGTARVVVSLKSLTATWSVKDSHLGCICQETGPINMSEL